MRIITFSKFDEHSSPIFKSLNIIKLFDLVTLSIAIFMFKFKKKLLPSIFNTLFITVNEVHNYRSAAKQSFYLPKARTNYGLFNIRFRGPKLWNSISEEIKLFSLRKFKNKFKNDFISKY